MQKVLLCTPSLCRFFLASTCRMSRNILLCEKVTRPLFQESEDESIPSYPNFWEGSESGYYHTHGQCTKNHIEDDFSRPDPKYPNKRSDAKQSWASQKPSYVGTPGGFVKRFDPAPRTNAPGSGTTTTLQKGKCCPGENFQ